MVPQAQEFAPAPASPEAVPGIPEAPVVPEMSQEQMKANLQEMMAKLKGKYQEFDSSRFDTQRSAQENQSAALRNLFDLFESKGIDPNNPEEVKAFLDKLKESNPELFAQVEQALNTILGQEQPAPDQTQTPEGQPPVDMNMNINPNEAPSQNL